jgi:ketosteroid isomerase-like protein
MPPSDPDVLGRLWAPIAQETLGLWGEDLVQLFTDEGRTRELRELWAPHVDPEMEVVFEPPGLVPPQRGLDGLLEGWRLWVEQWASYRVEFENVFEDGDRLVALVRQVGRTIHGGVDVPSSPSAAVWTVRNGRIARMAFYLDRTVAARKEGFELP